MSTIKGNFDNNFFFYGTMEFVNKIKGDKVKFSRITGTCSLLTPEGPFPSYYR